MRRFLLVALILPVLFGCASSAAQARQTGTTVNLIAYSTPKAVMAKLITRFQHQPAGQGVSFAQSYGPSGVAGAADRRRTGGRHRFPLDRPRHRHGRRRRGDRQELDKDANGGIAANSVVAFVVRPGNPKHIHGWKDLIKPGVQVVTPDPFPSGSAKWNVLAAYGRGAQGGMNNKKAIKFVTNLFKHVVSQDSSGSNAAKTFFVRQGRRPDHLRERGVRRLRRRPAGQARRPQADDADPAADGGDQKAPRGQGFIKYMHAPKQQKIFRRQRLPAGRRGRS